MPAIAATNMIGSGAKAITETTLNGSDTLTYNAARNPVLILRNPTGGSLTPVIDGSGASTDNVDGLGEVALSDGYSLGSISAGNAKAIQLSDISRYLKGTIAVNSGTGLVASLLEF